VLPEAAPGYCEDYEQICSKAEYVRLRTLQHVPVQDVHGMQQGLRHPAEGCGDMAQDWRNGGQGGVPACNQAASKMRTQKL
jgi:hypothetical protein